MEKANNVIRIDTSLDGSFFRFWLEFLKPFHHLTSREMDVATAFLKKRFDLSKDISNPEVLDKWVMGEEIKKKVREECDITLAHFQVIMGNLRNNKFILDGKINPRFIPKIKQDKGAFQLLLLFELK